MKNWHVVQTERYCEQDASVAVAAHGFEVYVPMLPVSRTQRGKVVNMSVPRFSTYIFANFDRDQPGWQELRHGAPRRAGVVRILTNGAGIPMIVPAAAIDSVRAYRPRDPIAMKPPYRYRPGEPVIWTIAGTRREGVFVEYCGDRPMVRTWIFGCERIAEVSSAELEPVDKDEEPATNSAA